ncbi:hypothetical protein BGW36DRAFT_298441 [Talaromyces proteolyticus]|uniref:Uncharacterized protein n=1 Tax=Talaromyces proteolyticus TaxID=1131652 RepID=A0AAD4PXE7_9EURO|nr:uncharacterized protein BGW36DRAFT_298441 [Talaromyces proteolyticus]KAH8696319.1 hypothetical protein BGW36DRAFT_298441 [Talaromyces proteolyticus]
MEVFQHFITVYPSASAREILEECLKDISEIQQLDIVTGILNIGANTDERLAELVHAAWEHLCDNDLWSFGYESLEQYRHLISYRDTIRPIIQRFKKSNKTKFTSVNIIEKQWNMPLAQVLPSDMAPESWSKHILVLLARLTKYKVREDAIALLEDSIKQRPPRSRNIHNLMASDVSRVLQNLAIPNRNPSCSSHCTETYLTVTDRVMVGLVQWAKQALWSKFCLFHLQCLTSHKLGNTASLWSRSEIINHLEQLLSECHECETNTIPFADFDDLGSTSSFLHGQSQEIPTERETFDIIHG